MEEESYFFRLSKYQQQLIDHIKANPSFIQPESQRDFILKRLQDDPLLDLSISRNTFNWGIPFPKDPKHVMYVWFDALTNYLTGVDWPAGERASYFPCNVHIIGKDIVWFHSVIWPAMLLSANIPLPATIFAHGFVNDQFGKKMSKSIGNTIDPVDVLNNFPADTFRLYLIHSVPFGNDLSFQTKSLILTHNADLADALGNLVNRVTRFCKDFDFAVPDTDIDIVFDLEALRSKCDKNMLHFDLTGTYGEAINATKEINNYLTVKEPWKIKNDQAAKAKIMRSALESVYIVAHFLSPFIPATAESIFKTLNTPPKPIISLQAVNLVAGTKLAGSFAFSKIPIPEEPKQAPPKKKNTPPVDDPNQSPFSKLDIRVGHISKVWKHPNSDKLWCEEINVGLAQPLQIASGLQQVYTEEQMLNARVLVVCNLKPAKLGGFTSSGMVLCAKAGDIVEFVVPPKGAVVGERVFIEGGAGEPATAAFVKKRKIFEQVAKELRTNEQLQAAYEGNTILTSAGPCVVSQLKMAPIS